MTRVSRAGAETLLIAPTQRLARQLLFLKRLRGATDARHVDAAALARAEKRWLATLDAVVREDGWTRLEELGAGLEARVAPLLSERGWSLVRSGSVFWMSLQPGEPPRTAECIGPAAGETFAPLFSHMFQHGISIAPSAFEVGFLSLAHTEADLDRFAETLAGALAAVPV